MKNKLKEKEYELKIDLRGQKMGWANLKTKGDSKP